MKKISSVSRRKEGYGIEKAESCGATVPTATCVRSRSLRFPNRFVTQTFAKLVGEHAAWRGETAAIEDSDDARIAAKIFPLGIYGEQCQMDVTDFVSAIEPFEGGIEPAKPGMYKRRCVGRNVFLPRHLLERVQYFDGFASAP